MGVVERQIIEVRCGSWTSAPPPNVYISACRFYGDVLVLGERRHQRRLSNGVLVEDTYVTLSLGPVAVVVENWCSEPGTSGTRVYLGTDREASLELVRQLNREGHRIPVRSCAWCREGDIYDPDAVYCDRCIAASCPHCGALPDSAHYEECPHWEPPPQ